MLHGLDEEAQICSGYTSKLNYEKEFVNLDSTKIESHLPLDIVHPYFNSGYSHGTQQQPVLYWILSVEKYKADSDLMEYSEYI